jgi:hypothetical protein
MMEGPPAPPSASAWDPAEVFKPGVIDLPTLASPSVRLRYRSTTITLPSDWVMAYLAEYIETRGRVPHDSVEGSVAGTGVVLDMFWPRFRSRVLGLPQRRTAYGRLIGCWMLPYNAEEGMPTSLFFQTAGEQRAMHDLTLQMLHAYLPYARVPVDNRSYPFRKLVDDDGWCDGLENFIRGMLEGEPRGVLDGELAQPFPDLRRSACSEIRINYADGATSSPHAEETFVPPCIGRPGFEDWLEAALNRQDGEELFCRRSYAGSRAMGSSLLLPWDDYSMGLNIVPLASGGSYVWYSDLESPSSDQSPWPKATDVNVTAASVGYRTINFQPAHLAYDSEIIDLLMFMAQLCLDHYRHLVRSGLGGRLRKVQWLRLVANLRGTLWRWLLHGRRYPFTRSDTYTLRVRHTAAFSFSTVIAQPMVERGGGPALMSRIDLCGAGLRRRTGCRSPRTSLRGLSIVHGYLWRSRLFE